ncbi:MAG TPA: geranylgeranyl reductase family protein [Acidimicrobiales bacterium]|nr:geranylgeranyl reductase family protein [Acidimicrobiales bacterium]
MLRVAEIPTRHFDVVIVGGGPSGSACAYWLAAAGWSVCLIEKKTFPREKTCGDGLTPRSVHQLNEMGLADELAAHGHRYDGLRAFGFGASLELAWPEHPVFPDYGYTITRFDLDGLVAAHAESVGATVVVGAEATDLLEMGEASTGRLPGAAGVSVRDAKTGDVAHVRATYVVVADGQNSRLGRALGVERVRDWPMGMALRGYYSSERHDEPWIESHLDIRSPEGEVVPGYGWIFPLGDGRVNVGVGLLSTGGKWKGVNTTKLQEYFVAQVAQSWGLSESTKLSEPTGGRLPMGLARGPRVGSNTLVIGDAAGTINPFNGEGIAYGYETGRLAAGVLGEALVNEDASLLALYDERLESAYGEYYKVARAFVRLISEPAILAACVGVGMRIEPLMRELLAVMANLMRNDRSGPAEMGYRALSRLVDVVPESVINRLLDGEG